MPRTRAARDVELLHFEEACELLRHYSGLRFRQLTIYAGINGGLLFVMFRQSGPVLPFEVYSSAALGILAAFAFVMLEYRLMTYLDHYRDVVRAYERTFALELSLYDEGRRSRVARGRLAVLLFIASAALFWAAVAWLGAGFELTTGGNGPST